jgi:hypothetical protein
MQVIMRCALAGAILLAAACGDDDPDPQIRAEISAVDQSLADASSVRITSVFADEAGFVAIYLDDAGARGALLGSAPVARGASDALDVALAEEVPENARLRATLHRDTGTRGEFEHDEDPSLDPPALGADGEEVEATFDVVIEIASPLLSADDQVVGEGGVVRIAQIDTATASFVRLVQQVEGAPSFPTIGLALVPAGRHRDLPVALERDGVDGETLYALLHADSNGDGQLSWTGLEGSEDPPIEDGEGEPLVAEIVLSSTATAAEIVLADAQVATSSVADIEIKSVIAAEPGFVAIFRPDGQGGLQLPALGHAAVGAGLTAVLAIPDVAVGSSTSAIALEAVLHRDSDADGVFDYDGGAEDPPALGPDNLRISAGLELRQQEQ